MLKIPLVHINFSPQRRLFIFTLFFPLHEKLIITVVVIIALLPTLSRTLFYLPYVINF